MRTTVDIPDGLLRAARAKAASVGESIEVLLERAVRREVGAPQDDASGPAVKPDFPLIPSVGTPWNPTPDDLRAALENDEPTRHGL